MKKILLLLLISFSLSAQESSSGIGELNCENKTDPEEKEKCEECQRIVQEQGYDVNSVPNSDSEDNSSQGI